MAVLKYKSSDGTWKTIATKGGNGVTDETDPIFSASPAASITDAKKAEWDSKYTKPSGGIPASDLASDVFLQGEKGEKGDKGDTGATGANGTNGKDGADGEDGATFTPSVDANGNLSWTNNKGLSNPPTVNIKGPKGDSGEGGGGSSYAGNYPVVNATQEQISFQPNTYYKFYNISTNDGIFIEELILGDSTVVNEYLFEFHIEESMWTPEESATLVLPEGVVWANGEIPPMLANKTYVISIVNNLAVYAEF